VSRSSGPQQRHKIPEMDVWQFAQLMKERFQILHEPLGGKAYWYRFTGSPYNAFCTECRSLSVMAHNRGSRLSPLVIKQVLAKFGVSEKEFLEALEGKPLSGPSDQIETTRKPN